MHEFETFVYLDMEKTGTTFTSRMLNKFAREECLQQLHHRSVEEREAGKFYFISVRNPLDCYLSLYSFGCENKGKLQASMGRKGLKDLYDGTLEGFSEWLRFTLKAKNAQYLGDRYNRVAGGRIAKLLGFQSYRYLRLSLPDPEVLLKHVRSEDDIREIYAARKLQNFVVRHETFVEDLCRLVSGPLAHAFPDQAGVLEYIRSTKPLNTSERVDAEEKFEITRRLRRRLAKREWLAAEILGYGVDDYDANAPDDDDDED